MDLRLIAVSVCVIGSVLSASAADAAPTVESEPNDTVFQRTGPVGTDGAEGTIATANDLDIFLVRLRPQRQIKVTYAILNRPACTASYDLDYSLRTPSGESIGAPSGTDYLSTSQSSFTYSITTPGIFGGPSQDYLLRFRADGSAAVGCRYRVSITGSAGEATDAIDSTASPEFPLAVASEPNDVDAQATGPMQADTSYSGAIETSNDIDLLYVPIRGGTAPTFELTVDGGDVGGSISNRGTSSSIATLQADRGTSTTASPAATAEDRTLLVRLTGDTGATWRLRVTPPLAVGVTPLPPAPVVSFTSVGRQVSISRSGGRYRGRVTSSVARCNQNVLVTLRRTSRLGRSYGTARTRGDGSWTLRRGSIPGKVFAELSAERIETYDCSADTSRTLRRR